MPDGEAFMNEGRGYQFSEKDCGLTLLPNSNGEYEQDVVFIKDGEDNQIFTASQLEKLEGNPIATWYEFRIAKVELEAARNYLDGFIPEHTVAEDHQLTHMQDLDSPEL